MELSWESSKNFSMYNCTIVDNNIEKMTKRVNLLFVEINNGTFFFFFFTFYQFHFEKINQLQVKSDQ